MACDLQTSLTAANCYACGVMPGTVQYQMVKLALLCRIKNGITMACDVQTLLNEANCYSCVPPGQLGFIELALLCQIATGGASSFISIDPALGGAAPTDALAPSQKAAKAYIDAVGNTQRIVAAGTVYTLTNANAAVVFGTTSPVLTIDKPGVYMMSGYARIEFVGATFAAGRVVTVLLRRTNNTAGNISTSGIVFNVPVVTTVTHTMAELVMPPLLYTTANANDIIEMWADVSALPSAGSITVAAANLQAVRILTG